MNLEEGSSGSRIAHEHKAKPNVIQWSENTLGIRTRESQFFYVWLELLLPVMFRIIVVRSKANCIHKFPQLVGLKISHRYDGLQLIQTANFSRLHQSLKYEPNHNWLHTVLQRSWRTQKPSPKSSRGLFFISHLKCSNRNLIDNVRLKKQKSSLNICPSSHLRRWIMGYATLWARLKAMLQIHPEDGFIHLIYSKWVVLEVNMTGSAKKHMLNSGVCFLELGGSLIYWQLKLNTEFCLKDVWIPNSLWIVSICLCSIYTTQHRHVSLWSYLTRSWTLGNAIDIRQN